MNERLIAWAISRRWLVIAIALAICLLGVWSYFQLPIDAYPDISPEVVQVITTFSGRATEEVERQVTIPIEIALRNVPRVTSTRSRTIFGLSEIQLNFEEGVDKYWARQRVLEKLPTANLPDGVEPELGPLATAYGEILRYEIRSDGTSSLMTLRELNDWVVVPRLLRVPGIAEVSNFGGLSKQFSVELDPSQLRHHGLTFDEVVQSVKSNNSLAGGSVMRRGSSSFVIRGSGSLQSVREIERIFVKSIGGTPIYLRDVAWVGLDFATRSGIFSKDERDESVEGIVLMRRGENPSSTIANVQEAIDELNRVDLRDGTRIDAFYNRQFLVDSTLSTVTHTVSLGITSVVFILIVFLGRPVTALMVAFAIPFSLLFALVLMYLTQIPFGLLSIGAIDFGIIVDGAIIMAEHIAQKLNKHRSDDQSLPDLVLKSAQEIARPVFFSVIMIVVAYLPLLSLRSIEGLLFRPMALTMVYALVGALLFAFCLIPVFFVLFFPNGYRELHNPMIEALSDVYCRCVAILLRLRWITLSATFAIVVSLSAFLLPRLGFEFLPYMDEGVIWIRANFPEGTALEQTSQFAKRIREIVKEFEDIDFVSCQAGRNDSGTDPFPSSRLETMIGPKPRDTWKQFQTKRELITSLGTRLRSEFPTTRFNFTQPIIDSVTEVTNGTSANLAIEISGQDPAVLLQIALKAVEVLRSVPGSIDANIEQEGPQPQLLVLPDRALCARYGVRIEDVTSIINTAIGAQPIGRIFEGERRFDIVARFDRSIVNSPEALGRIPVFSQSGSSIPLSQVANIELQDGQTLVARQNGRRRLTVRSDIVGRDQGSFVAEAQQKFAKDVKVPEGYTIAWLGMFENLTRAREHFMQVMPITVGLIYLLLLVTFRSQKAALLLLVSVPFAFVGALVGLWFRKMNLNVSTGVGFAALFGVSIMNGVLMIRSITEARASNQEIRNAVLEGARNCLRPILLASLVAVLGLLPASLANGLGSDVQRPLATVIVWGLSSSTILTLFVVPILYVVVAPSLAKNTAPATH